VAAIQATNRTQRLVLAFFVVVWVALVTILLTSPQIYDEALKLGPGDHRLADLAFLMSVSVLIAILVVGVFRRWRWIFWLVLVAFLFGFVRVIASVLELMDLMQAEAPAWYIELQAAIGVAQVVIAMAMIAGYRKGGAWGAF
jgi:hypothetical protein